MNYILPWGLGVKTTKWLYHTSLTSNQENKDKLLSLTFKIEENKVPLISGFEVKWLRYSHFVVVLEDPV